MRRILFALIVGLAGTGTLISLGVWQLHRLTWKEAILARIDAKIADDPVPLPADPDPKADRYMPVTVSGTMGARALRVLVGQQMAGAGYLLISPLDTGTRRVLVQRGFIKVDTPIPDPPKGKVEIVGNLNWPEERSGATPANDVKGNMWFARDVDQMAQVLNTDPVLVIAKKTSFSDAPVTPVPVDTSGIPNDHLQYAITWFSLAAVWLLMSGLFLGRKAKRVKGDAR